MAKSAGGTSTGPRGGRGSGMRKGGPDWYNADVYGGGWIPLMRKFDKIMKTEKTGPYAETEKLKIEPKPDKARPSAVGSVDTTGSGSTTGSGATTTQDLKVDQKTDHKGGATKPPPKKKIPPKKEAGNPSDTGGGGTAGDANL